MSKLSTKEFSAAVGVKLGTVKAHISRGKLERDAEGYIDTDTAKNRRYIKEKTKGQGLYNSTPSPAPESSPGSAKDPAQKVIKFTDKRSKAERERDKVYEDIDLRKKKAELNKAERDAELKRIEIEKKAGKLLPIELVQKILMINIQSIFRTFEGESENIAGIFSEVLGGSRKELAEIVKRQKISLGKAIDKAKEDSLLEIESAISEYTETRSRGERKI
jgi:hypothetical protein